MISSAHLRSLQSAWSARWPDALAVWSRFTRLKPPRLCLTSQEAMQEGLTGSFAMIRLVDQAIVVSLPQVAASGVGEHALEVLAHEIGHHVLAPATLTEHGRLLARTRHALATLKSRAPLVANLYTDLLINDRLQRDAGLRIDEVYRKLAGGRTTGAVWKLYMRIYEILWRLDRDSLSGSCDDALHGDAILAARLVRVFARDWLRGAGRFATLLLPYLVEDQSDCDGILRKLSDACDAGAGGDLAGLTDIDEGEETESLHPALDPLLDGDAPTDVPAAESSERRPHAGQMRQPFEYGELLRAAGIALNDHEAAVRYYRERALPLLVPFPSRPQPRGTDPLPEGLETWNVGDPLDAIDWLQTVLASPRVVPGLTTLTRVQGVSEAAEPKREPLDLDLYVDSSGSMADPQRTVSYPALAGAVICLSALRAGARVQATLWSGKHEFLSTPGFIRDETAVLRVLTGYFGGGTAFPIHVLRDTFAARTDADRPVHIMVISDDGVTTMFDTDEEGTSGWSVAAAALAKARGGGTMVLNIPVQWASFETPAYAALRRARAEQQWEIEPVAQWADLVAFARRFSQRQYGSPSAPVTG